MSNTLCTHVDVDIARPADRGLGRRHRLRHRHRVAQGHHRDDARSRRPPGSAPGPRVLQLAAGEYVTDTPSPRSAPA